MIEFGEVKFERLVVHNVGNKSLDEQVTFSNNNHELDETVGDLLMKYFLTPFKSADLYQFQHATDLSRNEVYHYATQIFEDPLSIVDVSKAIAQRLYEKSNHPQIKSGEFYVTYFKDCVLEGELVDAIGLFKSENKDTYLKVTKVDSNLKVGYDNGININKLDKGCLIFNTDRDKGYAVSIVDNISAKGNEALYWKEDLLKIKRREDDYYHTSNEIAICKSFVEQAYEGSNEINKQEQVAILSKAVDYFVDKDAFNADEFASEVISAPELRRSFKDYKADYVKENQIEVLEDFDISDSAVKKNKGIFKSVMKLDKNFSVYVHGDSTKIVRGYDEEKGLNFYTLYFNQEK